MTLRHDNGPAVSALSDDRRAAVRSELLTAIHHGPDTRSTRKRTMIVTAAVASVAAALVAGSFLAAGYVPERGPIVMAADVGQVPMSTLPCPGAELVDASEVEGATYLLDDPPVPLTRAWARVDECPLAVPLATFIRATGMPDDSALTVWGPDARAWIGAIDAIDGAYTIELPGSAADGWLLEYPWGVAVQWSDGSDDYVITSAGIDVETATAAAVAYSGTKDHESVQALLPDHQFVPIAEPPPRIAMWIAEYGDSGDPSSMDNPPNLSLSVTVGGLPATALASTRPVPAIGLTLPQATMSEVQTGDNGGFRVASWTTETGAEITLSGNFTEEELRVFAEQVRLVLPDDPRIEEAPDAFS